MERLNMALTIAERGLSGLVRRAFESHRYLQRSLHPSSGLAGSAKGRPWATPQIVD